MLHSTKTLFEMPPWPIGQGAPFAVDPDGLAAFLAKTGVVAKQDLHRALALAQSSGACFEDVLRAEIALPEATLARAKATHAGYGFVDLRVLAPDPRLLERLGPATCLGWQVLPWRIMAGTTWIAVPDRAAFDAWETELTRLFGTVAPVGCDRRALQDTVSRLGSRPLRDRAEARVPADVSVRSWPQMMRKMRLPLLFPMLAVLLVIFPAIALAAVTIWLVISLTATTALRGFALANRQLPTEVTPDPTQPLPVISILVPMYNEPDIAPRLLRRLGKLDYPRGLLDVVLVLEQDDSATQDALAAATLPPWMRVLVVPDGTLRTKPRAMNYALDFCHGSIIGIYDAEDAPEPGQLRQVAAHFAQGGENLACLQGALDYYNPRTNWLARSFTIEYAAWFRVVMPALQRLRLPMPLGGTTLFIRRDILNDLGAWDAHNVTEDADLGVRIARAGYRTEMLASTTEEEANCRLKPWLRQRSRWIKGHLLTWAVHMRNPVALWRDLGAKGFLGYQVIFLGAQSQVLLAPIMWSFWPSFVGMPHPLQGILPGGALMGLFALFLLAEALSIATGMIGVGRTRHRGLRRWAPALHFYHPLAAIAGWKAVVETVSKPFYWAKTSHGHFDTVRISVPAPTPAPGAAAHSPARPPPGRVVLFRRAEATGRPAKPLARANPASVRIIPARRPQRDIGEDPGSPRSVAGIV